MDRKAGNRHALRRGPRACHRRLRSDHGAAVIEFALLLPFLAVLIFGTVDLGRAYQLKNRLTNAAREGAWYGQFHPCDPADIQTAVSGEDPKIASLQSYSVATSVSGCPSGASGNLTVTASAKMRVLTPFIGAITGQNVTVSGSSTVAVQ